MSTRPAALIQVNNNLPITVQDMLVKQLFIDIVLDGYDLDQAVLLNPNYAMEIKEDNLRLLVNRDLSDMTNRYLFDVVIYFRNGLISVLEDRVGPPGISCPVVNITWEKLGISNTWP
jgi:hypothetical protein